MAGVLKLSMAPAILLLVVLALTNGQEKEGGDKTSDSFIDRINKAQSQWTAGRHPQFKECSPGATRTLAKGLLSWIFRSSQPKRPARRPTSPRRPKRPSRRGPSAGSSRSLKESAVPPNYDLREKWPKCFNVISKIAPQDCTCGASDWAVSVVRAIEDRFCIQYEDNQRTFSASQIIQCCGYCGQCSNGVSSKAYDYLKIFGVPTGVELEKNTTVNGCKPYSLSGQQRPPHLGGKRLPFCHNKCTNEEYMTPFEQDLERIHNYYIVWSKTGESLDDAIKNEILRFGSVTADMNYYEDFYYYENGVYAPSSEVEEPLKNMTVRILGWGNEKGKDYWLAAANYGQYWGQKGFVKIEAGNERLELETRVLAGLF